MNSKAVTAMFTVLIGCGLNNVFLEYLIKLDPGSGPLLTFFQFLYVALHGFIFTSKFGTVQAKVPKKAYLTMVFYFFVTSILNNWAFDFHIPVPLHMIIRAGSLIANMIMGIIVLKKRYTFQKFLSIFMITLGIIICTLYSAKQLPKTCSDCDINGNGENVQSEGTSEIDSSQIFWWTVGVIILVVALLLSARLGIYQEAIFSKHGKHPEEGLYYTHLLSLPMFVIYAPSIWEHSKIAIASDLFEIPLIQFAVPVIVFYLILDVLTQYLCISSVYVLTTECSSLTVTLIITLRKFMSLIISILYFQNPFTLVHWFGTALVFAGTLLFAEVPKRLQEHFSNQNRKVKSN